jgi:hypothetical protein
VRARDALWSQDATHLGRDEQQHKVEALAVKDAGTTTSISQSIAGPATGEDVLALLEQAKLLRGRLPLVLAMDNGPANRNDRVCSYLARERVIVLWNVPYTPEHNAWVESLHGALEARGELPVRGADPSQGPRSLSEAGVPTTKSHLRKCVSRVTRLLKERVCPSRGGFSAAQLDSSLPCAEDLVRRERFYEQPARRSGAPCRRSTTRARRRAEREAILCTLEQLGLVTRNRGTRPASCSEAARLS